MTSYSMSLILALLLAAASQGFAQTALSDWTSGVATNYGGPSDGDNPSVPTFGLLDVSYCSLLPGLTCCLPTTHSSISTAIKPLC